MSRAFPWLVLFFISLMAGAAYIMIKYLVGFIAPADLLVLQFVPVSIVSILLLIAFYRAAASKILSKYWWYFLVREAMAVLGFQLALLYGESVLPAGISALIIGTWPVMTIFLAWTFLGESLTSKKIIGGLIAFAGAAAVIALGAKSEASFHNLTTAQWLKSSLVLLIAPISAAVVTVATRWYLNKGNGEELPDSFLFSLISRSPGGFFALIAFLIVRPHGAISIDLHNLPTLFWILVAILAFYNSLLGFWLWNWALQRLQAGNVASFTYIQTIFALVIAWIFLSEPLSAIKIIGAITIVIGVLIANIEPKPIQLIWPKLKEPITPGN